MSRIGKHPVEVPDGTEIAVDGNTLRARGRRGEGTLVVVPEMELVLEGNLLSVRPRADTARARVMWGTTRTLASNLVAGVSEGFEKRLEISGVGYRAAVEERTLTLQLGFSHDVRYPFPEGIEIRCESPTSIVVAGADRQRVGQTAAEIRGFRKPEPYNGKGIRYAGEYVLRKEGKKK